MEGSKEGTEGEGKGRGGKEKDKDKDYLAIRETHRKGGEHTEEKSLSRNSCCVYRTLSFCISGL